MLGYVYVMSNEAMLGKYKIGCTSRHPHERANELNTTGVPKPFVIEYCINIDNYENIEKLVHKKLSTYHYGKEFFECDLEKCILTVKQIADCQSKYSEEYRDPNLKEKLEGHGQQYLLQKDCEQREEERIKIREEQIRRNINNKLANIKKYTELDAKQDTENNKHSIYGDTSQQLYYYTTKNKQCNDKELVEYERKEKERKARSERLIKEREERLRKARKIHHTLYREQRSYSELNNRIEQIDKERKAQRVREEQRRKDWLKNKNMYAINYEKKNDNHQQQDISGVGSEIFTIFFIMVIIPLVVYLLMQ